MRSFDLDTIVNIEPDFLEDVSHEHDDDVTSFVYRTTAPMDRDKLEMFFSATVAIYGALMLRYKGVLNLAGVDKRAVFQGVHMIFGADIGKRWGTDETRATRIVFIGKQLPVDFFKAGLDNCVSDGALAS
jgi:G3E family GTPase